MESHKGLFNLEIMAVSSVHPQVNYTLQTHSNEFRFPYYVVKDCLVFFGRITTWNVSSPFVTPWRVGLHSLCALGRKRFQRTSWNMSWSSASLPCPPLIWSLWSFTFIWCWINSSVSSCSRWSSLVRLVRRWPDRLPYLLTHWDLNQMIRFETQFSLFFRWWPWLNI